MKKGKKMINEYPQTLTIAGSDCGGGAGMQVDLKTMQMRRVFGTSVIVAITAQNTLGVQKSYALTSEQIDEQFASIAADFKIKACKTGMLADVPTVKAVAKNLKKYNFGPYILDPVMIAKGGAKLLTDEAIEEVKRDLVPLATLITPNLPEAEKLTGMKIVTQADMKEAAQKLQALGAKNVLMKAGHFNDPKYATDYVLLADQSDFWMKSERIETKRTHGTGDTISSCIVSELAKGKSLSEAIKIGKKFVTAAIKNTIQVGHGHGPLNLWAGESINEI